jgi:hypothetical protein
MSKLNIKNIEYMIFRKIYPKYKWDIFLVNHNINIFENQPRFNVSFVVVYYRNFDIGHNPKTNIKTNPKANIKINTKN